MTNYDPKWAERLQSDLGLSSQLVYGIDKASEPDFSVAMVAAQEGAAERVKKYVERIVRKKLQGFVGQHATKELHETVRNSLIEIRDYLEESGVLAQGHEIAVWGNPFGSDRLDIQVVPPRKEESEQRNNNLGMSVANMDGITHLAKETKGAAMTKDDLIKRISEYTGISPDRLLIERCGQFSQAVDVLHGTEDERWAATAALKKHSPAAVATMVHAKETGDFKVCGYAYKDGTRCGARLKIVETRFSGRVQAKSRCSNPLCPNAKHWMPVYRPATTARPPAPCALVVDHGFDEPAPDKPRDQLRFPEVSLPQYASPPPLPADAPPKVACGLSPDFSLHKDIELLQKQIALGIGVPEKYLKATDGNYSSAAYRAYLEQQYAKFDPAKLYKSLKEVAKEKNIDIFTVKAADRTAKLPTPMLVPPVENRFATVARKENLALTKIAKELVQSGRVSSSHPNEAAPPQSEEFYHRMPVRNTKTGSTGNIAHVYYEYGVPEAGKWMVLNVVDGTSPSTTGAHSEAELKEMGWVRDESVWWPEHIDTSWVGRHIIHRESGEVCTLGHYAVGLWYVHVPFQGTWRFQEQDIFKLFIPAPPKKDELSDIAHSMVKPRDFHQEVADQFGITREEAKVRAFVSLYGSTNTFTKVPLAGFSKLGKKDPKQG